MSPGIQLLYKGCSSARREKDNKDLVRMLPVMEKYSVSYLKESLIFVCPDGHDWLGKIEEFEK